MTRLVELNPLNPTGLGMRLSWRVHRHRYRGHGYPATRARRRASGLTLFEPRKAERLGTVAEWRHRYHATVLYALRGISAERGFVVLTYDYRGIGNPGAPSSATMEQWARSIRPR